MAKCNWLSILLLSCLSCVPVLSMAHDNLALFKETCECAGCDLTGANLANYQPAENLQFISHEGKASKKCNLVKAIIVSANLANANFNANILRYRTASSALDYESVLGQSNFRGANFSDSNLFKIRLVGVKADSANFARCNMTGADFTQAQFFQADFRDANLAYATAAVDVMNGFQSDFTGANFSSANLQHARLTGTFINASFHGANLQGAILQSRSQEPGQKLWKGADFTEANLRGADIGNDGKVKKSRKKISENVRAQAIFCRTRMPNGQLNNRDCELVNQ